MKKGLSSPISFLPSSKNWDHEILDEIPGEPLVARLHGGVRCEDGAAPDDFRGFVEGQPLVGHERGDSLEDEERRMAFVDVIDAGVDAQLLQEADPAPPEEDFLLDPGPLIGGIESRRDPPVLHGVLAHIRIQQEERDSAHLDLPYSRIERPAGKVDGHLNLVALVVLYDLDGQVGKIALGVLRRLDAVPVDGLPEEPSPVKKTDTHHGDVHVAGRFQGVSREGAEAA
jgi:hypothetical protein